MKWPSSSFIKYTQSTDLGPWALALRQEIDGRQEPRPPGGLGLVLVTAFSVSKSGAFPPHTYQPRTADHLDCKCKAGTEMSHSMPGGHAGTGAGEAVPLMEPAQTASVIAEMQKFLSSALEPSGHLTKWGMTAKDKLTTDLIDEDGTVV